MKVDTELRLDVGLERFRAHRQTGLGTAYLNDVEAGWFAAKVGVKADHALYFGARQIERAGDHRQCFVRHVAEAVLDGVQHGQGGARKGTVRVDQGVEAGLGGQWVRHGRDSAGASDNADDRRGLSSFKANRFQVACFCRGAC